MTISLRISILVLGVTLATFFAKQYSASRHKRLIAQHREKVADTYKALHREGKMDDAVQNATLLVVIDALLREPPSPFLKDQPDSAGGSRTDIQEIVRAIREQGKT